jgi:hypothetical protein
VTQSTEPVNQQLSAPQTTTSIHQVSPPNVIAEVDLVTQEYFKKRYNFDIPAGLLDPKELLEAVPDHMGLFCIFHVLVLEWQAGGTYLKATQEYIRKCSRPSHVRDSTYLGLGIFDLIAGNVKVEEQFELRKLYLEQDLRMPRPYEHGPGLSWILLGRWD